MNSALASGSGLASLLATIRGAYPQARVTSGYRGPNNPLTLRNPASMHAMGSPEDPRAVDVAPIPGVSFGDYVNTIRQAGVPVAQAFDEASHPFPWTTGPNWHIAQGQAPQMAAPRKKPASLADLNQPAPVSLDAPPIQPQASSLADLTGNPPQLKQPSKFNFGNLAGILGDALMAYGGMQPQFGPRMAQQQDEERQMGFDREKLNAELQQRREAALIKAQEPPEFAQNAQWFASQPPQVQAQILNAQDAYDPKTVVGPQGTQLAPRVQSKTINGKTYHNIGGEWFEEVE